MGKINSSGEDWKRFLKFASNHFNLNASEKLQVYQRNPNATCLATYEQWKQIGKFVTRGQHGIRVNTSPDRKTTYFDITQTDEAPLTLWKYNEAFNELLFDELDNIDGIPTIKDRGKNLNEVLFELTHDCINSRYSETGLITPEFCDFVAQSICYSTMSRLSVEPDTSFDFEQVKSFNNEELSFLIGALSAYTNLYLKCAKQVVKTHSLEEVNAMVRTQQEQNENEAELQKLNLTEYWRNEQNDSFELESLNFDDVSYLQQQSVIDRFINNTVDIGEEAPDNEPVKSDFTDNLDVSPEEVSQKVITTANDHEDTVDISDEIKLQILKRIVRTEFDNIEKSEIEKKLDILKEQPQAFRVLCRLTYGDKAYDFDFALRSLLSDWNDPLASVSTEGFISSEQGIMLNLSDDSKIYYSWTDVADAITDAINNEDGNSYHYGRGVYKVLTADNQLIHGYSLFTSYKDAIEYGESELESFSRKSDSYLVYVTTTSHIIASKGDFPFEKLDEEVLKANNITVQAPEPVLEEESKESHIISAHDKLMQRNYKKLEKLFPQIISGEYSYMHFESTMYEPLSVEKIGNNLISIMQTYVQNGDLMRDPDIVLDISHNRASSVSFENSGTGTYEEYTEPNYYCDSFVADWFKLIETGRFVLTRATRIVNGEDEELTFTKTDVVDLEDFEDVDEEKTQVEEATETTSEVETSEKEIDNVLDEFLSDEEAKEPEASEVPETVEKSEKEEADENELGTISSTSYLIPADLNDKINQLVDYLGVDRDLVLDLLSQSPTEETLNEFAQFNRVSESCDNDKVLTYFRNINNDPEMLMLKANTKKHKLLREFFLSNGEIDIPVPAETPVVAEVAEVVEEPYKLRSYPPTRFTFISDDNREGYRMYQDPGMPTDSIWGEVQSCHRINKGIYEVSTASHGGVMMPVQIGRYLLSQDARRIAQREHGYLYFEEDCDWSVAFRELLDKGVFENLEEYYKETYSMGPKSFNTWLKDLDETTTTSLKRWHNDYYVKRSEVIFRALSPTEKEEELGQVSLFGLEAPAEAVSTPEPAVSLMSDASEVQQEREEANEPEPITLEYSGNAEALAELRDNALSLGATVINDNANGTVSVSTYENHKDELDKLAYELGLTSVEKDFESGLTEEQQKNLDSLVRYFGIDSAEATKLLTSKYNKDELGNYKNQSYNKILRSIDKDKALVYFCSMNVNGTLDQTIAYAHARELFQNFFMNEGVISVPEPKLLDSFDKYYDTLYKYGDSSLSNYDDAMANGDAFMRGHTEFMSALTSIRSDFISSDREMAAFGYALADLGVIADFREASQTIENVPDKGYVTMRKVGDFYEMYGDNARIAASILGLHITQKDNEDMVGFPDMAKKGYADTLRASGYNVLVEEVFSLGGKKTETVSSSDDLRKEILSGTGFVNGKTRVYEYYKDNEPTIADFAKMLKNEYGVGGHSGNEVINFVNHNGKGIEFQYRDGTKVNFTWNSVAKLTAELIDSGEYFPENSAAFSVVDEEVEEEPVKLGDKITYQGRHYTVDKIDKDKDAVTLVEQISGWYPVSHTEVLSEVIADISNAEKQRSQELVELGIQTENEAKNFVITNNELGFGGPKEKYKNNVAAIRTLKQIEAEKRSATDDEKEILSEYVGWGGIPDAFNDKADGWSKEYDELKELLTEEEYTAARASVNDAFFTQPAVIRQMYDALESFGFKGGRILEPSCGVGNFIGCCPESLSENSKFTAVEIDSVSGRIARQLYPKSDIQITGYENAKLKESSYDVVIGNVPFGQATIIDRKYNKTNAKIHDYFFLKSLEMVKPNGIIAFITSSGTLDKNDSRVREMISEKADFIGPVRLPNTAFKKNAGTEVVSDIIFLQKRMNPQTVRDSWIGLGTLPMENIVSRFHYKVELPINGYYAENPEMVCGELHQVSGRFGYTVTVDPFEDRTFEDVLSEKMSALKGKVVVAPSYSPTFEEEVEASTEDKDILPLIPGIRDSSVVVVDNEIIKREGTVMRKLTPKYLNVSDKTYKGYVKLAKLMEQTKHVISLQSTDLDDKLIAPERQILHELYEDFVTAVGHFDDRKVKAMFKKLDSDDGTAVLALEKKNDELKKEGDEDYQEYIEADIFTKRTAGFVAEVTHADTVDDAFQASFALKGYIDLDHIAKLCDKSVEDCISELNGTLMFRDPQVFIDGTSDELTKGWIVADEYLSGEVVAKYSLVEYQAQYHKELEVNLNALKAVQPEKIKAVDIEVQLGSPFVKPEHIERFIYEVLERDVNVEHNIKTSRWYVSDKTAADYSLLCTSEYGTKERNALFLVENSLNLSETKIYDTKIDDEGKEVRVLNTKKTLEANNKADLIKDKFREWIYQDAARTRDIEDRYNEMFNSTRLRTFDGSHLTFNGSNPTVKLKDHQKNAVARILYGDNALLAHVVGAGKTYTMCAGIMEQKRIGTINKALVVVPNHLLAQWGSEFNTLYPGAKLLLATSEDFKKENRKKFLTKIALNDYDAIIMGHSTFSQITLSPEKREQFYKHEIDDCMQIIKEGSKKDLSVKDAEIRKKQIENNLKKLEYVKNRESVVYFEELGVDALYVDEAHLFKNLHVNTKLSRIAGISTSASKRAEDMLMKIQYITEKNASHKGVVFATGTPVSNSMTEMYVMQKYLQSDYLERKGLQAFDSWIACYGKIERSAELGPTGQWRMKTRCGKFNNVPELLKDFKRIADVQTRDMLNLPVPELKNGKPTICISKPSDEQKAYILECADRAEAVHKKMVPPNVDNMLCITNDGKMCALDYRLIDPSAEDRPDSKVNMAVENILEKWEETKADKLTQAVFLDKSTPSKEFNLYDDIKQKLIKGGIPESEIAFIHDAKNDAQKLALFDKVNAGEVRVILGSTEKMGAGTNMQKLLCAEHHIDVPWRPSDIEQREGRILRQGNTNKEVEIFRYVTEETFDSYSWQTIETKQKYISQVMTDKPMGRSIDDLDEAALSYAEIKMLATGDTRIKEQLELQNRVAVLKSKKAQFEADQIAARDNLAFAYPKKLKEQSEITALIDSEVEYRNQHPVPEQFKVTIAGTEYTDRAEAGKAVKDVRTKQLSTLGSNKADVPLCDYRGFKVSLHWVDGTLGSSGYSCYQINIRHKTEFQTGFGVAHEDVFNYIDNALDEKLDKRHKTHHERLETIERNIELATEIVAKKFPLLDEYNEKNKRLTDLTNDLQLNDRSDTSSLFFDEEPLDTVDKDKNAKL